MDVARLASSLVGYPLNPLRKPRSGPIRLAVAKVVGNEFRTTHSLDQQALRRFSKAQQGDAYDTRVRQSDMTSVEVETIALQYILSLSCSAAIVAQQNIARHLTHRIVTCAEVIAMLRQPRADVAKRCPTHDP